MYRVLLTAGLLMIWACDSGPAGPGPDSDRWLDEAAATITPADVAERVGIIAHDSMGGRATPSPGLEATASYIAAQFQAMGLDAAGTTGYLQRFDFTYTVRDESSLLIELGSGDGAGLEHGQDYLLLASEPERGDTAGPILWGGAAAIPEAGGLPMAGRVVLYDLPVSQFDVDAILATFDAAHVAITGGATGIGFVAGPDFSEADMARAAARTDRFSRWVPELWLRESAADSLLSAAGYDLATLRAEGPQELTDSIRVRALLTEQTATPPNVAALLPGSDESLGREHVVVTAHFDHLGTGLPDATGDSIRNGADDNGSGTAAVLELAEAMASLETAPARSILFLLVSAEEWGLLGSTHFAHEPTVPMSSIVANVNLDMVGRNDPGQVIGVGKGYTSIGALADSVAEHTGALGLDVIPDPAPSQNLFFRSDQLVFACRDIPALFLTTGLHEDYHSVSDEVEYLDTDKIARVARLGFFLVNELAAAPEAPTWTEAGLEALSENTWCP